MYTFSQWGAGSSAETVEAEPAATAASSSSSTAASGSTVAVPEPATELPAKEPAKVEVVEVGDAHTPPARRRASDDAPHCTPDRKKRRLTRPRKL